MKNDPKRPSKKRRPHDDGKEPEWTRLYHAFREAFDWALDVAASLARDFPEEVEAVERVRVYMRKRTAGHPAQVRIDDVLFTVGLLISAIERDIGPTRSWTPASAPITPLAFPGADTWEPRLPRRFTSLAAGLASWLGITPTNRPTA
ncbi:MAG: hypothetical protein WKG01_11290 [Kofleriaceae bacterium]